MIRERPGSKSTLLFTHDTINLEGRRYLKDPMHAKRASRYFTFESLFLLACLTVSLLILPLVLPPLPPPPMLLLWVPIFILVMLMVLAFMPCGVRGVTRPCG